VEDQTSNQLLHGWQLAIKEQGEYETYLEAKYGKRARLGDPTRTRITMSEAARADFEKREELRQKVERTYETWQKTQTKGPGARA
jgi:hypothetical protein